MSDLFHEAVPLEYIQRVFAVMVRASQHTFQILTKRPERALQVADVLPWPPNIWMGTSVENALYVHRVHTLRKIGAAVRFLSVEPLLGPIRRLPLEGIHWVIVGGESGPGARPMDAAWVESIRDQCLASEVAFYFKQWGGIQKKRTGRCIAGRTWDEMPKTRRESECQAGLITMA
jgi:protein gp37